MLPSEAPTNHSTILLDMLGLVNLNIILLLLIFNEITLCSTHPEARMSTAAEQEKPDFYSSEKLKCLVEAIVINSLVLIYLLMHPDRFFGIFFEILVEQEGRQIGLKT